MGRILLDERPCGQYDPGRAYFTDLCDPMTLGLENRVPPGSQTDANCSGSQLATRLERCERRRGRTCSDNFPVLRVFGGAGTPDRGIGSTCLRMNSNSIFANS